MVKINDGDVPLKSTDVYNHEVDDHVEGKEGEKVINNIDTVHKDILSLHVQAILHNIPFIIINPTRLFSGVCVTVSDTNRTATLQRPIRLSKTH